jgi:hypothetical protein
MARMAIGDAAVAPAATMKYSLATHRRHAIA